MACAFDVAKTPLVTYLKAPISFGGLPYNGPKIFNTDQGVQFTSSYFTERLEKEISNHLKYGTYVYGRLGESPYLRHVDGTKS